MQPMQTGASDAQLVDTDVAEEHRRQRDRRRLQAGHVDGGDQAAHTEAVSESGRGCDAAGKR